MAMKPEVKKILLDALKSGEYEKTTGRLARNQHSYPETGDPQVGYCCLGVLTVEGAKEGVCAPLEFRTVLGADPEWVTGDPTLDDPEDGFKGFVFSYPPASVYEWSGLTIVEASDLAMLNDSSDTFAPVIEYIETNL